MTVVVFILAMYCDIQYDNTAAVRFSLSDVSSRKLRRVALPERTAVSIVIRLTNCDVKARTCHVIKQLYTCLKKRKV
jgi:type 1 fimbria pilin